MNDDETKQEISEMREMLEQNIKLLEQNNRILRKMQRSLRNSMILRMFYWLVIIGSMFGIYYYLQPFVDNISDAYTELISIPEKLKVW